MAHKQQEYIPVVCAP